MHPDTTTIVQSRSAQPEGSGLRYRDYWAMEAVDRINFLKTGVPWAEYEISAKELGLKGKSAPPRRRAAAAPNGPTYRGPNRETWVGGTRGRKPSWFSEALAQGKTLSDLAP